MNISLDIYIELALQTQLNLSILTDYISGMTSEDFYNICKGIAVLKVAFTKKSAEQLK